LFLRSGFEPTTSNKPGLTAERCETERGSEATTTRRVRRSRVILHGPSNSKQSPDPPFGFFYIYKGDSYL
jgi:hypothetical protein